MARFLILIVLLTALGCHGHNRTSQSICAPGEAKVTAEFGQMMRDSADAWTTDTALVFARFHNVMKEDESYATGLTTLLCKKIDGRWERGLNENTNGLLCDWLPKGSDFKKLTNARLAQIQKMLNNRPRKCLNYRTPLEVLNALPGVALRN